jgi:acetyl-CoA C-acetyltransferase
MMRNVFIAGMGATPVAEHWTRTATDLAREALGAALGPVAPERIGALYVGNALGAALGLQAQIAPAIAAAAGMRGVEAHTFEAAGASGGMALRQAYLAVASGVCDLVAVVGVEKVTDVLEGRLEAGLALATDTDWEAVHGATLTAQWALLMRRYMHTYGYAAADFAPFPVNAHANGTTNRDALYRFPISSDKVVGSPTVADPLALLDCATPADGAAALLLSSDGLASELGGTAVRIAASAAATDVPALHRRADPLWLEAAARSASIALRTARLLPGDIQAIELSDPHGIAAVLALEAAGFTRRGTAVQCAKEGAITPRGSLPLATGGGYKARGDAGGANGIYQVIELARQLRGEAGVSQVTGARAALAQCLGGIGATAVTHVLVVD